LLRDAPEANFASGDSGEARLEMGEKISSGNCESDAARERLRKKREETERRRNEKRRLALEEEIERLETAVAEAQEEIAKEEVCADFEKLTDKSKELDRLKDDLEKAYAAWYACDA
jgi:predicted  nucleic acid-binding Zn-ribbon protein